MINIAQFVISIPLFMVLFFGIGFILNMILKTTWFPAYMSIIIFILAWVIIGNLKLVDFIILLSGVLGAFISSYTIRALRNKGYRMF